MTSRESRPRVLRMGYRPVLGRYKPFSDGYKSILGSYKPFSGSYKPILGGDDRQLGSYEPFSAGYDAHLGIAPPHLVSQHQRMGTADIHLGGSTMNPVIKAVPHPTWAPLPHPGCLGVEGKVLLKQEHLSLALLRFAPNGSIHEHPANINIDVICLEGHGMTGVDGNATAIKTGEQVHWPAGHPHRLWTEDGEMMTLMVEHYP